VERLIGITVALAFLGLYLIIQGASHLGGPAASATPEEMTLAALLERGPGGNPHVRVRDFVAGEQYVEVGGADSVLRDAYVPIWPEGRPGRAAVVKTNAISAQFSFGGPVEGMVSASLPADVRRKLAGQYPGTTFTGMVLDSGARPEAVGAGVWQLLLGIALIAPLVLVFLGAWLLDRRQRRAAQAALEGGTLDPFGPKSRADLE
jgi:hypothetical protein